MIDFREFMKSAEETVANHYLGNGAFSRWTSQNKQNTRSLGVNEYSCADAVNILYTLNKLPERHSERIKLAQAIQALQNPQTGLFSEGTHDPFHTTAHCIAALELLDAHLLHPLTDMLPLTEHDKLMEFMEKQPWEEEPCLTSHRVAALYAALVINGDADDEWQDAYFKWLWDNTDENTGLLRTGHIDYGKTQPFQYLVGTFHYMFNFEYKHLPMNYPKPMIDTCIQFYDDSVNPTFGKKAAFEEMDWIYCINRAMRQTDYRYKDCKERLKRFEKEYSDYLLSLDFKTDDNLGDLHQLFGTLCGIAEMQSALPGTIRTDKPLRLVLDRRPFI